MEEALGWHSHPCPLAHHAQDHQLSWQADFASEEALHWGQVGLGQEGTLAHWAKCWLNLCVQIHKHTDKINTITKLGYLTNLKTDQVHTYRKSVSLSSM